MITTIHNLSQELVLSMRARLSECHPKDMIAHVLMSVCRALDVRKSDVKSLDRSTEFVEARYIIMYILVKHQKMTLKGVAKLLNRDHSTVLAGVRKYQTLVDSNDKLFLHKINMVMEELGEL